MKKIIFLLATAALMSGCTDVFIDDASSVSEELRDLTVVIDETTTRVTYEDGKGINWEATDAAKLGILANNAANYQSKGLTISEDKRGFFDISVGASATSLLTYYPFKNSGISVRSDRYTLNLSVDAEQSQTTAGEWSMDSFPMVAPTVATIPVDNRVNTSLNLLGSIARFIIYGNVSHSSEKVLSVSVTADKALSGTVSVEGTWSSEPSVSYETGGSKTVTVTLGESYVPANDRDNASGIYMALLPVNATSVEYAVTTNLGTYTIKTGGKEFVANTIHNLFFNLDNATFSPSGGSDIPDGGGEDSGIYLGIMGFNDSLYPYSIRQLTDESKAGFDTFIDGLGMKRATVLYHSVDQAINTMQSVPLPADLSTAAIVTFTDGLDQGSLMINGNYRDEYDYLYALNNRIINETVYGLPITSYTIGLKGNDAETNTELFDENIDKLASSAENANKVGSMADVNAKFKEIAEELSKNSYVQTISLTMPGRASGTRIRFTFDNVNAAEKSDLYIEGTFNLATHTLEDVQYSGLRSTSGTSVKGSVDGVYVSFVFEGVHTDNNKLIDKNFIDEWFWGPSDVKWNINSEISKDEDFDIVTERSSAVIMLVLDCSSSLGDMFVQAQTNAKDFINTLYEAIGGDIGSGETPGGGNDSAIYSTTPIDLSLSVWKDGTRYYLTKEEYGKANLSDAVIEGLCVVSGTDAPFLIALKNANSDEMVWKAANDLFDLPTREQGIVISARWTDVNNALKAFGGNTISYAWTSYTSGSYYYYISGSGGTLDSTYYYSTTKDVRQVVPINNSSTPLLQTPDNDLTLAVTNGYDRLYIDSAEFKANGVPSGYSVEGLAVCSKLGNFILAIQNASSNLMTYSAAMQLYGKDALPSYNQGIVISARWTDVNNALKAFGGNIISTAWTSYTSDSYYYYISGSGGTLDSTYYSSTTKDVRLIIDTF